ncbi:hypothetical protein BLNAU_4976 [Blattamonas nauphoetae]|uniref:Uncharacterized protein n=1 Tax=Blattamonas nauphoetae TaxID=2049346 RepID=A0ABQ9Y8L8_9EUKA|nr:hypothetical protein BLNAU_4976 [Blattamonas nauphoetae]
MRNSITPTLLQTSSLLNTVVTLFRSPSIPLQTTEWTPQLGWHNRNWNGQPSRSSAGLRVNCIARRLIRRNSLSPLDSTLSTHTGVVVVGVVGEHQVWEMQMSEEEQELLHRPRAWTEQLCSQCLVPRLKNGTCDCSGWLWEIVCDDEMRSNEKQMWTEKSSTKV